MPKIDWKRTFRKNELFTSLTNDELDKILHPEASQEKSFAKDDEIIRHGKHGRGIYLVGDGAVAISTPGPHGREIELTTLESGEFFGEMSLLRQQPRTATVKAQEDCTVLRISAEKLQQLLQQRPDILAGIFVLLSERMRETADKVIAVSYHDLNDKVELFSVKLDAELKAMNSTLVASQAVFDQTTTRANEVINSTDRNWTRMTVIGSALTTVITMMIAGFGWLGISSYQEFTNTVGENSKKVIDMTQGHAATVKASLATMTQKHEKAAEIMVYITSKAREIDNITESFQEKKEILQSNANFVSVQFIKKISELNAEHSEYYIPILQKNLNLAFSAKYERSATVAFMELYNWIISTNTGDYEKVEELNARRSQIAKVLVGVIESNEKITDRNRVLAYYFLLAQLAMQKNEIEYGIRRRQLSNFLQTAASGLLLENDKNNFEPGGFELAIDLLELPPDESGEMRRRIKDPWKQISSA